MLTRGRRMLPAKTATAGTAIQYNIDNFETYILGILLLVYTAGATAHTLTVMRPLDKGKLDADAASAQADIIVTDEPASTPVSGDIIAVRLNNGTCHFTTVSAYDDTDDVYTITLTDDLPAGAGYEAKEGAQVYFYDVVSNAAHVKRALAANSETTFESESGYFISTEGEPVILHSDNVTAAGTFNQINVGVLL